MIVSVSRYLYIPFGMSKSERASEQQLASLSVEDAAQSRGPREALISIGVFFVAQTKCQHTVSLVEHWWDAATC